MHMHTRARNSPLVLVRMCNPQIRGGGVLKSAFTRIYCADRPTDPLSGHRATPVGSLRPTDSRRAQRGQSFGSVRPTDRPPRAARRGRFGGRMDRPTDPPRGPALTLRHHLTSHRLSRKKHCRRVWCEVCTDLGSDFSVRCRWLIVAVRVSRVQ